MVATVKKITPRVKKDDPVLVESQQAVPAPIKPTPNTFQLAGLVDQIEH